MTGAYVFALVELAKRAIRESRFRQAIDYLEKTERYPENLGEGKLYGRLENDICYFKGVAFEGLGDAEQARQCFRQATQGMQELGEALYYNDQPPEQIFYQGLAFEKLQENARAQDCFNRLVSYGQAHINYTVKIDYFAVSLPDFLIFDEDLTAKNGLHCLYLMGLGYLGLKKMDKAEEAFGCVLSVNPCHLGASVHKTF